MTAPITGLSMGTGAVVRKPSGKEPAGCGLQRCRRFYGDFDTAVENAAADDVAGGAIAEPHGGSDGARGRATGVRGRSAPCRVLARTSAVAAGPGPARQIGTAAANEVARAHEVSIQMAAGIAAGLYRAGSPAYTSMMRMAEPQHGQGLRGVGGSAAMSSGSGVGGARSSSLRASTRLSAFTPLASRP
jgi:hypothetical protein